MASYLYSHDYVSCNGQQFLIKINYYNDYSDTFYFYRLLEKAM